ncbi:MULTISPECIES: DUF2127 domain-containing protein [unclassified Rhodococcus (in: high G+C Gram-positive bacteria)]|uniref:DUF2127 domain-containing protein n=1 Tax=unclassified Rhodococcus (in: high G+C Gram-positive bacteria) TaxID=192944 RepID=UPI001639FAB8|nr:MULTISPECIES: DUF2127 domain-containing protein [unclassified Rhodococcus (in: high G+C Gram-positive bacteria)]MBC2638122.1 DUF2127 domain-containing protein [Rhodococcus sp. 3A]MBC2897133.1 DUF2127 domain-containing protein [Rhodococcus sp. 4CII]
MDFALRSCSWHGHETYAPDEPALRARLRVDTPAGEAWRCLRCANFVPGPPKASGPADKAPEVPRGRLLRDRVIMRLLAVERVLRALVLILVALGIFHLRTSKTHVKESFDNELPLIRPLANQLGWNIDESKIIKTIDDTFALSSTTLTWLALAILLYALLQLIEAVGLWLVRRWGEYFAVVATSLFLPLEIFELFEKVTVLRVVLLLVNIAAVVWLIWSKRLFGVRGGGRRYHEEHSAESLLTVERAAVLESGKLDTEAPAVQRAE